MSKTVKVRIKRFDVRPDHWCHDGEMDEFMGQELQLTTGDEFHFYTMDQQWEFHKSDFEVVIKHDNPNEKQVGGTHYVDIGIEPWEVIERAGLDFWEGNAVKYIMRHGSKNGVEDLKKAIHYIEKKISILEASS